MIELHGMKSPNVLKVVLALEEMGLAYELHPVNVWGGQQYSPEFLAINPNNKVPAIVDREGPGGERCVLFESGAILFYLAEKTGKFMPKAGLGRYEAMKWLMFQMAGIGPMCGQLTHFKRDAPAGNDYGVARYQTEVRRQHRVVEQQLRVQPFLAGPEYTIADMAAYPWIRRHEFHAIDMAEHPSIARWLAAIDSRPATQRFEAVFDRMVEHDMPKRNAATKDDFDRYFGRGAYSRP